LTPSKDGIVGNVSEDLTATNDVVLISLLHQSGYALLRSGPKFKYKKSDQNMVCRKGPVSSEEEMSIDVGYGGGGRSRLNKL